MTNIYLSKFVPSGVRKEWERCSISNEDAARALDKRLNRVDRELPTSALAYFAPDDRLRVMACDMRDGRRIILRTPKKGGWSIEIRNWQDAS